MVFTRPLIEAIAFFEGLVYTNHLVLPRLRILRMWKPRKSTPSSMWTTLPRLDEVIIQRGQGDVGQQRGQDSSNAVGNFCFDVSLSYRRVERPRRVAVEV